MSSVVTGDMYCSCVNGKETICSPGLGVMKCSKSSKMAKKKLLREC